MSFLSVKAVGGRMISNSMRMGLMRTDFKVKRELNELGKSMSKEVKGSLRRGGRKRKNTKNTKTGAGSLRSITGYTKRMISYKTRGKGLNMVLFVGPIKKGSRGNVLKFHEHGYKHKSGASVLARPVIQPVYDNNKLRIKRIVDTFWSGF